MKDLPANTPANSGTQPRSDWTEEEKATLRKIATRTPRKAELLELFPGRSLGSIRIHLFAMRRELGIPKRGKTSNLRPGLIAGPPMLPKNARPIRDNWQKQWREAAIASNARFLEALRAVA